MQQLTNLRIYVGDFLDRAAFTGPAVSGSNHTSVRALAELFDVLILRVHGEVGVERGKGMSLHDFLPFGSGLSRDVVNVARR